MRLLSPLVLALMGSGLALTASAERRVLSDFESPEPWEILLAEGVEAETSLVPGKTGQAVRVDYRFVTGGGFAIIRLATDLDLPESFRFRFTVRGEGPANDLEFKLFDESGDNVWWRNRRRFEPQPEWQTLTQKRRHFEFAWGPAGAESRLSRVSAIEFAIASAEGGQGYLIFDDLTFEALPPKPAVAPAPLLRAEGGELSGLSGQALAGDGSVAWRVPGDAADATLVIDLGFEREFGGLRLQWADGKHARDFALNARYGDEWVELARVSGSDGGRDYIVTPDAEAREVRLIIKQTTGAADAELTAIEFLPPEFGDSWNNVFARIAANAPKGLYPRYYLGKMQPWTVAGIPEDDREVLVDAGGSVELWKRGYRVDPFVYEDGTLTTWADVTAEQSLLDGYLPIPTVTWMWDDLKLEISTLVHGVSGNSMAVIRYRLTNHSDRQRDLALMLGLRPFQVLPPWQQLNLIGGVGRMREARRDTLERDRVMLDGWHEVFGRPGNFAWGASAFAGGDVAEHFARGTLPPDARLTCPLGARVGRDAVSVVARAGRKRVVRAARAAALAVPKPSGPPGDSRRGRVL
jgi:hypothetical protein